MHNRIQRRSIPALASLQDNSLRVAAYCRSVPVSELQWTHYSTLVSSCPKWTFLGCYAGRVFSEKTEQFRGGIQQMISDCRDGKIDLIITISPSTIQRNVVDCFSLIADLQKLKTPVGIYFEENNLYTLQENMGVYLSIFSALAIQESKNKGKQSSCIDYGGANLLKRTRKIKGMTQQETADKAGIPLRHYQKFEREERQITNASFRIAMSVCKALDIIPDMLYQSGISFLKHKETEQSGGDK